ncbi:MAG TPA: hypothetical protein VNL77_13000 [Roseiflexaceae bacterium]|nr:hypothetical protein [Roseiflexaceae bacterium]
MDVFYETVTTFSFTLLGLWWAIIQFRHDEWIQDRARRRVAYSVHLSFLVPGVMSLGALLGGEARPLWQAVFVVAGLLGGGSAVLMLLSGPAAGAGWLYRAGMACNVLLYALVCLFALLPWLAQWLAPGLTPLQVEGVLVAALVFIGVSVAWEALAAPRV